MDACSAAGVALSLQPLLLTPTHPQLLVVLDALDAQIGPLLEQDGAHFNQRWGYLSRAGLNDRSQMSR